MGKTLIVIESPGKLPAYRKYLGPDYEIMASKGHCIDLPPKSLGVDIKKGFTPTYEVMADKTGTVTEIVRRAKEADLVLLMTDPDREGEAISWHLSKQFPAGVKFKRAATASITKNAILEAIKKAGDINMRMVDSYEARRILDRLCGFKTSYLVKTATGGPSAGRVQSAALRILAEREKEIKVFVPVEYWPVDAELLTPDKKKVYASVIVPDKMDIKTEGHAKEVEKEIRDYLIKVQTYETKTVNRNPYPPFITSTLQAVASGMFGWDQKKTMEVAQKLYEQGHITYMRTDSTHIVPEVVAQIRSTITDTYGAKYLPSSPVGYKGGKNAQEAHEAIRPTHIEVENASSADEARLYKMIWKRAVASQMNPEVREQVRATFSNGRNKVVLAASGSRQVFNGWKACWDYREAEDTFLPVMKVGDRMDVLDVTYEQKFTEPPPRYGVATFNSKLEDLGIARPSTLATVTKTLNDRGYVEMKKNTFYVTDLGVRVVDFLLAADMCFADVNFTKDMEDKLDDILNEKVEKLTVLTDFWKRLKGDIDKAQTAKKAANATDIPCPECEKAGKKRFLVMRHGRFGDFFSCEGYSNKEDQCKYTANVGEDGKPKEKVKKEPAKPSGFQCPNCGKDLLIRNGQYGPFLGCAGYPKCKTTADMDGNVKQKSSAPTGGKKFWRRKKQ